MLSNIKESEEYLKKVLSEDLPFFEKLKATKGMSIENFLYDNRCYVRYIVA